MNSPRFVSPPADQIDQLKKPFNEATKLVFEFFDNHLVREWEIYIHPHLNGLRPDFVLLNPKLGIAVFEVKDWDLNSAEYSLEEITDKNWILNVENENGENGTTANLNIWIKGIRKSTPYALIGTKDNPQNINIVLESFMLGGWKILDVEGLD
jgi:hypothetical protein